MDPGSSTWSKTAKGLPTDSTILKTNTSIQLLDGTPADIGAGIYNHHVVFFDTSKTSPIVTSCGNASTLQKATSPPKSIPMTIFGGTVGLKYQSTLTHLLIQHRAKTNRTCSLLTGPGHSIAVSGPLKLTRYFAPLLFWLLLLLQANKSSRWWSWARSSTTRTRASSSTLSRT